MCQILGMLSKILPCVETAEMLEFAKPSMRRGSMQEVTCKAPQIHMQHPEKNID